MINNIELNIYIMIKNQYLKFILNNIKTFDLIRIYLNIIIHIIEFIIHKYHNKAIKYINYNIQKIICNNILNIIKIKY